MLRRGLSAAVIDGAQVAMGKFGWSADADLQHDEAIIPKLIEKLDNGADIAIQSRFAEGGLPLVWMAIYALPHPMAHG